MDSLPRPRRLLAARILSAIFILPLLIAACSGGPGAASGGDPAAVVKDALAKVAAKDINGLANLACAGQADQVREQFDMAGQLGVGGPGRQRAGHRQLDHDRHQRRDRRLGRP